MAKHSPKRYTIKPLKWEHESCGGRLEYLLAETSCGTFEISFNGGEWRITQRANDGHIVDQARASSPEAAKRQCRQMHIEQCLMWLQESP